ncbi:Snf2 family helicase [Lasiodiplodia theobromae]|uniref:Snf2 family helicase n=1 Tax=Lasiodiplodia theobromae TaxID=45133 RepID=UPI0015C3C990|nr:Snf2 family helicase [Lasiodiplodia theobromae]KAF4545808.1 Snf2 family helicase [Lasiodiplodia theobromae]
MPSTKKRRTRPSSTTTLRRKKAAKVTKPTKKSKRPHPSPGPTLPPRAIMHAANAHRFATPFETDECPVCLQELETEVAYTVCGGFDRLIAPLSPVVQC